MDSGDRRRSYKIYTTANIIIALAAGIFGPFYTLFIDQRGGSYEVFSIALGICMVAQAFSAYFFGSHSDKIGRKPLLVIQGYAMAIVLFLYLLAYAPWQLYIISFFDGILLGIYVTVGNIFLADITEGNRRGRDMGRRDALINVCAGITMMLGGFFAAHFGIQSIFIIMASASIIASTLFLFVKEEKLAHD